MDKILYAKYSNQRQEKYKICTKILLRDKKKIVVKEALTTESATHIENMVSYCKRMETLLVGSKLEVLPCKKNGNSLEFDYVEGVLLDTAMQGRYHGNRTDALVEEWTNFFTLLSEIGNLIEFSPTPQFTEFFGDICFREPLKACEFSNLDITPDNIIQTPDGRLVLIDCEWCFDFPVPIQFILYRAIRNFSIRNANTTVDLYGLLNISADNQKLFERMEEKFSDNVSKDNGQKGMVLGEQMLKGNFNIYDEQFLQSASNTHTSCLYLDYGDEFSEENKIEKYNAVMGRDRFFVQFILPEKENLKRVRFDPIEKVPARVQISSVVMDGIDMSALPQNASYAQDGWQYFEHFDPIYQMDISELATKKFKKIRLEYQLVKLDLTALFIKQSDTIARLNQEQQVVEQKVAALRQSLAEMEDKAAALQQELQGTHELLAQLTQAHNEVVNSKFWKLTWPLRRIFSIFNKQ